MYTKTGLNLLRSATHPFEKRLRRDHRVVGYLQLYSALVLDVRALSLSGTVRRVHSDRIILEPCLQGMGAPQAGRRDHLEAMTLLLVGCLTHHYTPFVRMSR